MNIQTEHLENHTARLTVEVDPQRLEEAKNTALRKIAKRVEIPGFRKGKAPSNLVLRYVGEARILEDAVEELGQEIYRESLNESNVKPYGPGSLEDVKMDPTLTFVYTVPLQPSVDLGDYRTIRQDYTAPEITDEMVDVMLKRFQEQEAASEESEDPVAIGDRITIDIHSFLVDETEASAEDDDDDDDDDEEHDHDDDDEEEDDHHHHDHDGEEFIHDHDLRVMMREGDDEPIGPGFTAALLGAQLGETREFKITYPTKDQDKDIDEQIAGRTAEFIVAIKQIEKVDLPELNDEFAAKFTDRFADPDEDVLPLIEAEAEAEAETKAETEAVAEGDAADEPKRPLLTLDQLRERIRKSLVEETKREQDQRYADSVLEQIAEGAQVGFPEEMVSEQLDSMIQSLEQRLRQQGLSLEMYQSLTGKTIEDVRNDYRESAEASLKRSLVLFEIAVAEKLKVTSEDYNHHIDQTMKRLRLDSPEFRKTFDNPSVRENIYNRILQDKAFERLIAIGKGEAPTIEVEETESTPVES